MLYNARSSTNHPQLATKASSLLEFAYGSGRAFQVILDDHGGYLSDGLRIRFLPVFRIHPDDPLHAGVTGRLGPSGQDVIRLPSEGPFAVVVGRLGHQDRAEAVERSRFHVRAVSETSPIATFTPCSLRRSVSESKVMKARTSAADRQTVEMTAWPIRVSGSHDYHWHDHPKLAVSPRNDFGVLWRSSSSRRCVPLP